MQEYTFVPQNFEKNQVPPMIHSDRLSNEDREEKIISNEIFHLKYTGL